VRWVTGQEVVEVYATGSDRGDPIFAESGDASSAATVLTLGDRALAVYPGRGARIRSTASHYRSRA
jgi:myo-inositol 2-dehydrogenase/D-chiro-inositol 1-dehydrogenase